MTSDRKLMKLYFDYIYNPVYDLTTARFASYHTLQKACIDKLKFDDGDRVLCVGIGTGNEVIHILGANRNVNIVGIDYSPAALKKVRKKVLTRGKAIKLLAMDAQSLKFTTGSFDKVLCLHVMEFVEDNGKVAAEIIRVLKEGGQFVITYPSDKEGVKLGVNLLKDSIRNNINSGKYIRFLLGLLSILVGAIVYIPLLFRPKRRPYSRRELEATFSELASADFQIEDYPVYQDFIVYGRK